MKTEHPLNKEFSKLLGVIVASAGDKVSHLGKTVYYNPYGIIAIGVGKNCDEVARNFFPTLLRNLKGFKEAEGWVTNRLDPGTGVAVSDKSGDSFSHAGPPIGTRQEFIGGGCTRVTRSRMIVDVLDNTALKVLIIRDVD
jgi:hypothetical protein